MNKNVLITGGTRGIWEAISREFAKKGYNLIINYIKDCDTEGITKRSLEKFNIPYDKLYLHISDKLIFFKENEIDLCIEDSFDTCRQLTDNGIKSILMTTKMNASIDSTGITRVNNWDEIYNEIKKYKSERGN